MIYPNHLRLFDSTVRIHAMRHHHQTMELHPSSEASPWGGITSLHEAPPRDLRGITSWPWGTTTIPPVELHPYVEAPPWTLIPRFMELSPLDEAPPGTPNRKVHGITSISWGTTMNSHYKSHGITSYSDFVYVSPTNKRVPINTNIMLTCICIYTTNHTAPISQFIHNKATFYFHLNLIL